MDSAISAARWLVGKALGPVSDGLVEAWAASKELGPNVDALKMELLYARAMLNNTRGREISNPELNELLQMLRGLAYDADDVLDELDYFRIQDELDGTCEAANEHAKGHVHSLFLNAHHTAKAAGKLLGFSACSCPAANHGDHSGPISEQGAGQRALCCAWQHGDHANDEEEIRGRMRKLASGARNTIRAIGIQLHCPTFPLVHADGGGGNDSGISTYSGAGSNKAQHRKHKKETPKLKFERVGLSKRMKNIVEQLQPVCAKVTTILNLELLGSSRSAASSIAKSRPITTPTSIEPNLYGRDNTKKNILDSITQGKYYDNDLTILPIVGPGGIGKTTLIRHIYNSQEVQNHFQIKVWTCVSQNFNADKLKEDIKGKLPPTENEKGTIDEKIEQRIKSKRFLLILDDIWKCESDDWERLLVPLRKGQTKGNTILITTRFPVVAEMVKTTDSSIDLEGLDGGVFRELFLACVFGDEQSRNGHDELLEIGDMIVGKLKGSPLAAKTVGRLLRNHFDQHHWLRVLESREWEMEISNHDIMPALQLSYDHLPFHLQQCFSYCALFPEDHKFDSKELTRFWIGLDILHSECHNKTFEDIALSNLEGLVSHGFFKKDETDDGQPCYIIHDLLHNLALKVASHECVSLHYSNVRSVEIRPSIRHLSIITDGADNSDGIIEKFRTELIKLKTRLKVKNLQTLMIFGALDESFIGCLGDLFKEATALRVLHLPKMPFHVESILNKFSALVHLRYLRLGMIGPETHLPFTLSRFYHLRILDLLEWNGCSDLPGDMSNLGKLHNFLIPTDKPRAAISNVGKLQFLQELRFEVNKEGIGFELRQLGYLMELTELGIYNLERVHTKEATSEAKLLNKIRLQNLALNWDSSQISVDKEGHVLESLQPHKNLKELSIYGHGGSTCPKWLGTELCVKFLETLCLSNVAWEIFPPLGEVYLIGEELSSFTTGQNFLKLKRLELVGLPNLRKWVAKEVCPMFFSLMEVLIVKDCFWLIELPFSYCSYCSSEGDYKTTWFPRLREVEIFNCPNLVSLPPIPYTQTLCSVDIRNLGTNFVSLIYSSTPSSLEIQGDRDLLHVLDDKVLAFHNLSQLQNLCIYDCPPLADRHLQTLTSLKKLKLDGSNIVFTPLESNSDVEWQSPVEVLDIWNWHDNGKELTQLLSHFPKLSQLTLLHCESITRLTVAVEQQNMTAVEQEDTQATDEQKEVGVAEKMEDEEALTQLNVDQEELDGLLLFPASLANSLQFLQIVGTPELILVAPPALPSGRKDETEAGGLQALRSLKNLHIEGCPRFSSTSCCPLPSSLQELFLVSVVGIQSKGTLENLSSLTRLCMLDCGGEDLRWDGMWPLTTRGQLRELTVHESPKFFTSRDLIHRRLQHEQEDQQLLQQLNTDDLAGVLVKPICRLLSSCLTDLYLRYNDENEMKHFTKEQEEALQLLTSLQGLHFGGLKMLQCLPAGLHRLTYLKRLEIDACPYIQLLPKDGLPSSLQELDVRNCGNEKLKQRCKKLMGTIPKIRL